MELKPDKESINKTICEILERDFECERDLLKPDAKLFEELNLDSIDAVDLVVKLQKMTGKQVNPEEFKSIRTLQDLVDAVHKVVNS